MTIIGVNMIAASIIFLWATWCVISSSIHDGILGKLIYAATSIAAFSMLANGFMGRMPPSTDATLHLCMAALAIRHFILRHYWPQLRCKLMRHTIPQRRESDGI